DSVEPNCGGICAASWRGTGSTRCRRTLLVLRSRAKTGTVLGGEAGRGFSSRPADVLEADRERPRRSGQGNPRYGSKTATAMFGPLYPGMVFALAYRPMAKGHSGIRSGAGARSRHSSPVRPKDGAKTSGS